MLHIRRYRQDDADAVWNLHNTALLPTGAHAGNGPWDKDLCRIPSDYLAAGGEFLVGVLGDRVVAMGGLKRLSPDRGEIKRMRVLPEHQRKGFGQAILSRLEARAHELGITELCLLTTARQQAAQAFYRKNGYSEAHRERQGRFNVIFFEKKC